MADVSVKFVSQKINKVRWKQSNDEVRKCSSSFVTGSWDNEKNYVTVWASDVKSYCEQTGINALPSEIPENEPQVLCNTLHTGDILDLELLSQSHIVTASSVGDVNILYHNQNTQQLTQKHSWNKLHHHINDRVSPCTCISTREDTIVSAGEDGKLIVLRADGFKPVRIYDRADGCTIHAALFLKQSEIVTVNSIGQVKIWDIRDKSESPSRTLLLTGERVPLICVDRHPTQPHVIATGGVDGCLYIWDLREEKSAVSPMEGHGSDMLDVRFHPTSPDNLFTCSEDGSVWHWDATGINSNPLGLFGGNPPMSRNQGGTNPWLASDAAKHRLEINDVIPENKMPVNSIDIQSNTLICGTDGEAIYRIHNMPIR